MIGRWGAALLAALVGAAAAADDAEVLAHYDAYRAAFQEGRFDEANAEGEAAWRAAEAEWGATEDTAMLALNLARLRLIRELRAEAVEPALRVREIVDAGVGAAAVSREEAMLIVALAQFPGADQTEAEMDALDAALTAYMPGDDYTGKLIRGQGWFELTKARFDRRQWRRVYDAANRATLAMDGDGAIPPELLAAIAAFGVKAAAEDQEFTDAIILGHRAIAAFPAQPAGQPVNPMLGNLLSWDIGLHMFLSHRGEELDEASYPEPEWDEGRYPNVMGCDVEWLVRQPPDYPRRALFSGLSLGVIFEYYLDADGAVIRVDPIGGIEDDPGFVNAAVEAIGHWRAAPQPRAECRGPWAMVFDFQLEN